MSKLKVRVVTGAEKCNKICVFYAQIKNTNTIMSEINSRDNNHNFKNNIILFTSRCTHKVR